MTFGEAVLDKIASLPVSQGKKQEMTRMWQASNPNTLSNAAARRVADKIFGQKDSIYFDWEACRVREGYYRIQPGIDYCIQRAIAYSPFADLIWMETAVPGIPDARKFSEGVKKVYPNQVRYHRLLIITLHYLLISYTTTHRCWHTI
jgi:isocitrate lyase